MLNSALECIVSPVNYLFLFIIFIIMALQPIAGPWPRSVLTPSFDATNLLRHPVHELHCCHYCYNDNSFTHEIRDNGTVLFGSRDISVALLLATVNLNWSHTICPNKRLVL
jgi:hypothetical protein